MVAQDCRKLVKRDLLGSEVSGIVKFLSIDFYVVKAHDQQHSSAKKLENGSDFLS